MTSKWHTRSFYALAISYLLVGIFSLAQGVAALIMMLTRPGTTWDEWVSINPVLFQMFLPADHWPLWPGVAWYLIFFGILVWQAKKWFSRARQIEDSRRILCQVQ